MKKYLLLYLLILLAISSFAQQKENLVAVTGLKPVYAKGEVIKFNITNTTNQDLYVSSGLAKYLEEDGEWFEQVPDLSNYNCDPRKKYGVVFSMLKAMDTVTVEWKPKNANKQYCFNWQGNSGRYKVIVKVAEDIDSATVKVSTSTFTIN